MSKTKKQNTPNDQTIMFGSIVPNIFTSLHSSLHNTTQANVSTLPIIQHDDEESCETKLYSKISKVYMLHMDMAQLYAENELFVIDKGYSRKKRERIVNKFLALEQGSAETVSDKDTEKDGEEMKDIQDANENGTDTVMFTDTISNNDENETKLRYTIPTSSQEIPSADQMAAVDDEMISLRKQLCEINEQKYALQQQFQSLGRNETSANQANDALSRLLGKQGDVAIVESVQNIKEDKGEMKNLISQAQGLKHKMKEMEDDKPKSNETEEFGDAMKAAAIEASSELTRPKKKKTLEEDYQDRLNDRKVSGGVMKLFQKR